MAQRFWGVDEFRLALGTAGFTGIALRGGSRADRAVRAGDAAFLVEARAG